MVTTRNQANAPIAPCMFWRRIHGRCIMNVTDDEKISVIAALTAAKMKESKIPSAMSYDMAEVVFKELRKKGVKLPGGFTAALTMKIKDLLK